MISTAGILAKHTLWLCGMISPAVGQQSETRVATEQGERRYYVLQHIVVAPVRAGWREQEAAVHHARLVVQAQHRHVSISQAPVQDGQVGGDALRVGALGQDAGAALHCPPYQHLHTVSQPFFWAPTHHVQRDTTALTKVRCTQSPAAAVDAASNP